MENKGKEPGWWLGRFVWLTGIYVVGLCLLVICRWVEFRGLSFNELGDFLAGAFGPPAFLWLILGFYLQRHELQQSTAALRLQAEELRGSVEEQRKLAEVTREQFQYEIERRKEEKELEKLKSLPKFEFIEFELDARSSIVYKYRVLNVGNNARKVSFYFNNESLECYCKEEGEWKSGEIREIAFYSLEDKSIIGNEILIINFFDALGFAGQRRYRLLSYDGLKFDIRELLDKDEVGAGGEATG